MRAGVILAGGFSTRFGETDKVLADVAGVPMVRRVATRLDGVVDELVVNCRAAQVDGIERALSGTTVEFAVDPTPDEGPLAGIRTGLTATDATYAAVVAADMPLVDPGFVSFLFERARGHDAAVPRWEGRLQPTHAVYRRAAMVEAATWALANGDRRLVSAFSTLDHVVVGEATARERGAGGTFTNVNTREELRRVTGMFENGSGAESGDGATR
ncbi:molybdenum cofactor guanylyltransferase [Halococcus salsus]|uniref:molybdenum cofactor guanylyltransferase n=1 Tax=Halococcus salsus TaxID=2162894 RepID=UPI00135A09BC|nr:molybdenum cofactor guanylyltransferase [Halococcus salsus]